MKKLIIGIVFLAIVSAFFFTGLGSYFTAESIEAQVEAVGVFGPLLFILVYIISTLVFLPGSPITFVGGFLFGPWLGTLYVVIGATIGAVIAFLISRYIAADYFEQFVKKRLKKIYEYNKKLEKNGFVTVFILRLIPLFPFNGLNFGLGITKVRLYEYALATFIGIIPGTFLFIYAGSIASRLAEENFWQILLTDPAFYVFAVIFFAMVVVPLLRRKK